MYWKPWEMVEDTSTRFEFPKQLLWLRFLWPSKSRVCGELSKREGPGWVAKLIGANSVSVVCVCTFAHVYVHVSLTFYRVYLKDATATIIIVSRRTWHLFKDSYCSYMYVHIILSACEEHGEPRQLDEVFCFDNVGVGTMSRRRCGFHFGEILTATPEPKNSYERHTVCVNIDNIVLYYIRTCSIYIVCGGEEDGEIIGHVPHIECSLLYIGHFQSFALCLHTWCCRYRTRDDNYECY